MKRFGLIGHPLGHSFSKVFFNEKFLREGLDCLYDNFDLPDLSEFHTLLQQHPDLKGFNITIPYKKTIIPYLQEMDEVSSEIQAVNTVKVLEDGRLLGFNTDVIGLKASLDCLAPLPSSALVFGTGGASQAVQYVLKKQHIDYQLVSRTPGHGIMTYKQLTPSILKEHRLLINATPVGTYPEVNSTLPLPYEAITSQHLLLDLVYNPEETLFLKEGKQRGATTMNGLKMLYTQAEASWNIWNSKNNLSLIIF